MAKKTVKKKSAKKKSVTTKKSSMKKSTKKKSSKSDEHGKDLSIRDKLKARQSEWENAEAPAYGELPDGTYIVKIAKAEVNESKGSGRLQVSYTLKVVEGEMQNRNFFKHDGIDDEQQLGYYKASIARLGFEAPANIDEIIDIAEEMENMFAQITAKTKKTKAGEDFQSIYFNKPIDSDEVNTEGLEEIDDEEEDEADDPEYSGDEEESEDEESEDEDEEESEEDESEEEAEEEEEISYSKGDRVVVEIDGEGYPGTVKSVRLGKATVEFDDGDSGKYEFANLSPEEESGDNEGEEEEAEEESDDSDDDEGSGDVTVEFTDDDLKPIQKKKITAMAKKLELDPDDYDSLSELLGDIGEYHNVSGTFSSPVKLLNAIKG